MGYKVHGILQARILEWGAFPFSKGSSHLRVEPRPSTLQGNFFVMNIFCFLTKNKQDWSSFGLGFPGGSVVKNLPANAEDTVVMPGLWRSPGEVNGNRLQQPILVFLPGKYHGQRNMVGYSPWVPKRIGHDFAAKQVSLHLSSCSFFHELVMWDLNNMCVCVCVCVCVHAHVHVWVYGWNC